MKSKLYLIVLSAIFMLGILWEPLYAYMTTDTTVIQVNQVVSQPTFKPPYHKYMVFTNLGVFENSDSWLFFKFNSSDVQNTLMQRNVDFKIKYTGMRIPFFSIYPNIIKAEVIGHNP